MDFEEYCPMNWHMKTDIQGYVHTSHEESISILLLDNLKSIKFVYKRDKVADLQASVSHTMPSVISTHQACIRID